MSAYVVNKEHIDLMVRAALHAHQSRHPGDGRRLSWWRVDETGGYAGWNELNVHAETMQGDEYKQYVTPSQLGQMLVNENVASVAARYPDDDVDQGELPGPCDAYYIGPYVYRDPRKDLTPGQVFKAIDCLDYQSCEHDGWTTSEAYSFLRSLRKAYCDRVADYEDAPWGFSAVA
jgi:hypothetical protein